MKLNFTQNTLIINNLYYCEVVKLNFYFLLEEKFTPIKVKKCLHAFTLLQSVDYKPFTREGAFTRLHIIISSNSVKACEGAFTQNYLIINKLLSCEGVKALFRFSP